MQLHKSTVLVMLKNILQTFKLYNFIKVLSVMLMDVKMSTIFDILTFMSMTSFMNVLRWICRADGC